MRILFVQCGCSCDEETQFYFGWFFAKRCVWGWGCWQHHWATSQKLYITACASFWNMFLGFCWSFNPCLKGKTKNVFLTVSCDPQRGIYPDIPSAICSGILSDTLTLTDRYFENLIWHCSWPYWHVNVISTFGLTCNLAYGSGPAQLIGFRWGACALPCLVKI